MTAIATLVERATRYAMLVALPEGHKAEQVADALAASIQTLPRQLGRSLTWDQGNEMAEHLRFSVATGVAVYFCDPKSPHPRRPGRDRRRTQQPSSTNTGLPDTIRSTRRDVAMTA